RYENINRPRQLPVVESLDTIGIFSITKSKSKSVVIPSHKIDIPRSENYINLLDCVTKENREILEGKHNETDDRSSLFVKAVRDLLGWVNWLNDHNLNFSQNPQDIIRQAGSYFGFHDKRINAILQGVIVENCQPAAKFAGGDEACIKKVNRLLGYESKEDRQNINDINWKNWLKNRDFRATETVHQSQFEFPINTPRHNAIVAVRSGMGTGKTEAMLKIISESQRGSLIIGYRNNLLFH
ncbi:MAG: hypothetical protein ACKPE3_02645, partial [Sphaerospermopsis kisseleviana]